MGHVIRIMLGCPWNSSVIITALFFSLELLHTSAITVFYQRTIITGQCHSQLHMKFIGKMLKRNRENCGINKLKTGTDYLD